MRYFITSLSLFSISVAVLAGEPISSESRFFINQNTGKLDVTSPLGKIHGPNGFHLLLWKNPNGQYEVETPTGMAIPLEDGTFHSISAEGIKLSPEQAAKVLEHQKDWIDPKKLENLEQSLKASKGDGAKAGYKIDENGNIVEEKTKDIIIKANKFVWDKVKDNHAIYLQNVNYNDVFQADPRMQRSPVGYTIGVKLKSKKELQDLADYFKKMAKEQRDEGDARAFLRFVDALENLPQDHVVDAIYQVDRNGVGYPRDVQIYKEGDPTTRPITPFYK